MKLIKSEWFELECIEHLIETAEEFNSMDDFWEYIGGHAWEQDFLLDIGLMTQEQIDDMGYDMTDEQCLVSDVFFSGIFAVAHKG